MSSKTAQNAISMQIDGNFLGVKVHTGQRDVYNTIRFMNRKTSYKAKNLLRELRPIFNERLKRRIPRLRHQLRFGYKSELGAFHLENRVHGKHRPHEQIREPLGRIIDRGTSYQLTSSGNNFGVTIRIHNSRNSHINFHRDMPRVPRISTVWNRLDATCLPFVEEGYQATIYNIWLENTAKTLLKDLENHLQNKRMSRDAED